MIQEVVPVVFGNRQWRLFGAISGDRCVVAAQPADVRNVAARRITLRILRSPVGERERVFDRFYRRTGSGASGSGLGLAIAREIATRHGASITLQSSQFLGGLCACIRFERTAAADRPGKSLLRVA
jgi:hypothetical protein